MTTQGYDYEEGTTDWEGRAPHEYPETLEDLDDMDWSCGCDCDWVDGEYVGECTISDVETYDNKIFVDFNDIEFGFQLTSFVKFAEKPIKVGDVLLAYDGELGDEATTTAGVAVFYINPDNGMVILNMGWDYEDGCPFNTDPECAWVNEGWGTSHYHCFMCGEKVGMMGHGFDRDKNPITCTWEDRMLNLGFPKATGGMIPGAAVDIEENK